MCGIVALCYSSTNPRLGFEGGELLKRLEYRGYDSTGGAFIGADGHIELLKAVGAPSKVVPALGIDEQSGVRFIGQVRWATYGAVTQDNCQPHQMTCKLPFVGAHNGNIANTDMLKPFLTERGHTVVSDNDGEMITHLTEGYYAEGLADRDAFLASARAKLQGLDVDVPDTALLLIEGARRADAKGEGSYAAAYCDPASPGMVAIKSGSSLYAGLGTDDFGDFVVVSSDLTSVLSKTRMLIPLTEGQGLWFTENRYVVFTLGDELRFDVPAPKRSKLNVRDTGLRAPFEYFMDQEIASSPENLDEIIRYYFPIAGTEGLFEAFEDRQDLCKSVASKIVDLYDAPDEATLGDQFASLLTSGVVTELLERVSAHSEAYRATGEFNSEERALFADLDRLVPGHADELRLFDLLLIWKKQRKIVGMQRELVEAIRETNKIGGRVFVVASGTSYHAALTGAYFFNNLAGVGVFPCNPGMFRSMYMNALTGNDLLIGITQSGETKDLVDIFGEVQQRTPGLRRVSLVNNENSRIPQELSEFYLPILCGPEIAVAATKSFLNQVAVLFVLAASFTHNEKNVVALLGKAKALIVDALSQCEPDVEAAAQRLHLEPSTHILGSSLIGLAKEGALKVREVVLNHTEGYDAAEFKHGPNTILGKNTLFSIDDLAAVIDAYRAAGKDLSGTEAFREFPELVEKHFSNYPLLFVCPPDSRDVAITISQVHTHKIRGADMVMIAEDNADLALAVSGAPAGVENYWSRFIRVPATGDPNLFVFAAAVVLQRLSLRMSVLKMNHLDGLGVADHGVHPDAPKNVSKSITVD